MKFKGINEGFFILLLLLTTVAFALVLKAYYSSIFWAVILAVLFYPLKTRIRRCLGERNGLASLLTLLVICIIVFLPLVLVTTSLAYEGNQLYQMVSQNRAGLVTSITEMIHHLPNFIQEFLDRYGLTNVQSLQQKLSSVAMQGSRIVANSALVIGQGTFSITIGFGIMLYLLFFLLKEGAYLVSLLLDAMPLSNYAKHHLLLKFAAVSKATVKGTVVVAAVQGALGGIAFWFLGVEGSILWGTLMAFLSLIPAVGSAIIWAPVAFYFLVSGAIWKGVFLIVFFVVVIGLVDNILRPLLVGKETRMPDYLVLISTLGGMELFGINGFVIGPLVAALFISCWNLLSGRQGRENAEQIDPLLIAEGQEEQAMIKEHQDNQQRSAAKVEQIKDDKSAD